MPLFQLSGASVKPVEQKNFDSERVLQRLVESNLLTMFNCRMVATEFSTGAQHAGRIDTLGLSEDDNPVIIEYKKIESSDLINQSLFYLSWIQDHKGDFEIAARDALGNGVKVDWSDVRVLCIAPNFRKYDIFAVQVMGANIELWQYRLFGNGMLYMEEVFRKSYASIGASPSEGKDPVMVAAGKKAALSRTTGVYTIEQHLAGGSPKTRDLAVALQEYMLGLDPAMEESPKKFYVAYKISQNIACLEIRKSKLLLYVKLEPKKLLISPKKSRDVTDIGHYGTGDLEMTIESSEDLEAAKPFLAMAYQKVGG
jgi:predicted transport protein